MKRIVTGIMLILFLVSMLRLEFNIQPAKASGTIYIRADGSVDPPIASISSDDNITYTLTDNIYEPIGVERSNIIVDGAGYALEGTESLNGLVLLSINNVTIKNISVKSYSSGIVLALTSNCTIRGNNITNNLIGIHLFNSSVYNTISGNNIEDNGAGVWLDNFSNHNTIFGNNLTNNIYGISLIVSLHNTIYANNVANNDFGIWLHPPSSNNKFYHNYFVGNTRQVDISLNHNGHPPLTNVWDDGVGKGNYWSDYNERYPNATEIDGSGIWDTPYVIAENNQDNYPLVPEFPTWTSVPLILVILAVTTVIYKRRLR